MSELSWVDSDGNLFPLQVPGEVRTLKGVQGRTFNPVDFDDETVPFQAGERLRQIRHGAREVAVPLLVQGGSQQQVRDRLRVWSRRFDTTRGDGRLVSNMFGSGERELVCRFVGTLESGEQDESDRSQRFVAVFRAFDPFWRDTSDTQLVYDLGEESQPFFPFPPLVLSGGAIFVSPTVTNGGDVDAFPVWTIQGPGGPIILTNVTTGETLGVDTTLVSSSQRVIVDTRPFRKSIVREDGTNLYGQRTSGSSLWSLAPGDNIIQVSLAGATVDSEVRLRFRRRWLSA